MQLVLPQTTRKKCGRKPNTIGIFLKRIGVPDQNGCHIWQGTRTYKDKGKKERRGHFKLNGKLENVTRLAYRLFVGEIPVGLNVCHKCDNGLCCNPDHLFLGTTQDNVADRVAKGRTAAGERHWGAKITTELAEAIKYANYSQPGSKTAMAKSLGVSYHIVSDILRGKTWRHV